VADAPDPVSDALEETELYQVPTKRINEQVKRNIKRFPPEFIFQITEAEVGFMVSQKADTLGVDHSGGGGNGS